MNFKSRNGFTEMPNFCLQSGASKVTVKASLCHLVLLRCSERGTPTLPMYIHLNYVPSVMTLMRPLGVSMSMGHRTGWGTGLVVV